MHTDVKYFPKSAHGRTHTRMRWDHDKIIEYKRGISFSIKSACMCLTSINCHLIPLS